MRSLVKWSRGWQTTKGWRGRHREALDDDGGPDNGHRQRRRSDVNERNTDTSKRIRLRCPRCAKTLFTLHKQSIKTKDFYVGHSLYRFLSQNAGIGSMKHKIVCLIRALHLTPKWLWSILARLAKKSRKYPFRSLQVKSRLSWRSTNRHALN